MRSRSIAVFQLFRLWEQALGFVLLGLLARRLTPDEFGSYAVIAAVVLFGVVALSAGGEDTVSSTARERLAGAVGQEWRVRCGVVVAVLLSSLAIAALNTTLASAGVLLASTLLGNLASATAIRLDRKGPLLLGIVLGSVPIALVAAVAPQLTLVEALLVSAATQVGKLLPVLPMAAQSVREGESPDVTLTRRATLVLSTASGPILGRQLDVTIAALLLVPAASIGQYSAAYSAAAVTSTALLLGVGAATLPMLADELHRSGSIASMYRRIAGINMSLSVGPLAVAAAFAYPLMTAWLGTEIGPGAAVFLTPLCLVLIVQRLIGGGLNNAALTALHANRQLTQAVVVAAGVGVAADLLLIPPLGMAGAVLATLLSVLAVGAYSARTLRARHAWSYPFEVALVSVGVGLAIALAANAAANRFWPESIAVQLLVAAVAGTVSVAVSAATARDRLRAGGDA